MYIAHLQNCRRDKETFLLLLRTPLMLQIIRFSFLRLDWHTRCGHQVVMVRLICLSRKPPFHTSFLFFTSEIFVWYANQLFIPLFLLFSWNIFRKKCMVCKPAFHICYLFLKYFETNLYGMQTSRWELMCVTPWLSRSPEPTLVTGFNSL